MVLDFVHYFLIWSKNVFFADFYTSFQLIIAQSSAYEEIICTPFFTSVGKMLPENGFGFCPSFLEGVIKWI